MKVDCKLDGVSFRVYFCGKHKYQVKTEKGGSFFVTFKDGQLVSSEKLSPQFIKNLFDAIKKLGMD